MITLSLQDYCHNCVDFEAFVEKAFTFNGVISVVSCANKSKCEVLCKYIKKSLEEQYGKEKKNGKSDD